MQDGRDALRVAPEGDEEFAQANEVLREYAPGVLGAELQGRLIGLGLTGLRDDGIHAPAHDIISFD